MGLRHSGQWQEEVRNRSYGGGGRPNPPFASCLRGELLPQAATYPEQPPSSSPAARSHPVPPRSIPPRPTPIPPPPLIWEWGGTGWRVPLDSVVRAGLEGERSCPKMVTFIPFFKLKRGGV